MKKLCIASPILLLATSIGNANAAVLVDVSDDLTSDGMYSILVNAEDGDEGTPAHSGKTNGQAALKPAFVGSLKSIAGVAPFSTDAGGDAVVQTTFLTSTSDRHVDGIWRNNGCRTPVPEGERVGFYALNTNKDAHFDADDKCVPIEEGKLIHFDGHLPHHTVINSGYVSLLGPFHFKTMKNVGSETCCFEDCCSQFFYNPTTCQNAGGIYSNGPCSEDCPRDLFVQSSACPMKSSKAPKGKMSKGPKGTKSPLGPKGSKSPKSSKSSCDELCRELDDKCPCAIPAPKSRLAPTDCPALRDEICRDESGPECDCGRVCTCRIETRFLEGEYEPTDEEGFDFQSC